MLNIEEKNLQMIKDAVYNLGKKVVEANEAAYEALQNDKKEDLEKITLSSKKLLSASNEIDNMIVKVLALYSPEATDLRNLVAYLKITNECVRAGTNTRTFLRSFTSGFDAIEDNEEILEYTLKLQKSALDGFRSAVEMIEMNDEELIQKYFRIVSVEESKTDDLYSMIQKNMLKNIPAQTELPGQCFDILNSLRRLEKVADRAFSIANLIMFAKNGGEMHANN
jgi:phosphate transport system protein